MQAWHHSHCGTGRYVTENRYRHGGRQALFDGAGHRLTGFGFAPVVTVGAGRLAYTATQRPCAFGLPDRTGRRLTPPACVRLQGLAPNAVRAVRVEAGRLAYGRLDSLGRVVLPFAAGPLPYRNGPNEATYAGPPRYADTTTTR
ncbi:MAG: hypothetical protein ACRYFR_03685 [Janthinobacterium lividum]